MSNFTYRYGILHAEDVPLTKIAKHFGTPCYVYSRSEIESRWKAFNLAFKKNKPHLVCYAVKANSNIAVLNLLAKLGSGFDIVSVGELERVIAAGGDPTNIVFSGVGKKVEEMQCALEKKIKCFNVESANELTRLNNVATDMDVIAPVSFRVNPDVDAKTHPYISTGLKNSKFGIAFESAKSVYLQAAAMSHINIVGIDCHIGSQITQLEPFKDALLRVLDLVDELKELGIELQHLDIGGGLGITYQDEKPPSPSDYVNVICDTLQNHQLELIIEPGRSIVGNAGLLITQVQYLNQTPQHNFAIVDAAMNDLIRPALYDGWHDIKRVEEISDAKKIAYDIVGPVCETGDFLGKERFLQLKNDDLLAVCSAGAYGFTMASNYNSRPRATELMVDGEKIHEIRSRETVQDLIQGEHLIKE